MISWFEKYSGLSWFITAALAVAVFFISSLTFPSVAPSAPSINAILYHIVAFFLLGLFLLISLVKGEKMYLIVPAVLIAMTYGLTDEFHQLFVPGRTSAVSDFMLDTLGIIFAATVYAISLELRNFTQQKSPAFQV
jgi:VanZ family protein